MVWIPITIGLAVAAGLGFCAVSWRRIVPPQEAHVVVSRNNVMVCSSDPKIAKNGGNAEYYAIPSFLPVIGRTVTTIDLTIKEIVDHMTTYEKDQARYQVKYSLKYRVTDVETAAKTFESREKLDDQLNEVIRAAVRAITVKYSVVEARASKQRMSEEIENEITDDLKSWGLELINFVLCDFKDTEESQIISDISRRREVEIESTTREQNAEKIKKARMKEAESEEQAKKRELLKDEKIQEQTKTLKEKEYTVKRVETIKQAEIDKDKAIVKAEEERKVAEVAKQRMKLEGEGTRLKLEEVAKGNAAGIREKGLAEAQAKDKLQAALNKFKEPAIRALVAEKVVEAQKIIGVAGAEALKEADLRILAGDGNQGFDIGKLIASTAVSNEATAAALVNRIARPQDLGLTDLKETGKTVRKTKTKKD